jgi:hypothetical protein
MKHSNLSSGLVLPSGGWQSLIDSNVVLPLSYLCLTDATLEQRASENINSCLNAKISIYFETSGGQNSNLYSKLLFFFQHQYQLDIFSS